MASDNITNKLTIKSMLFTRAIPNYVIPVPTAGHKVYGCTDCGDKFLFKSSYEYHVNRKSVLITYNCRHCQEVKIFNNRCNLLSHIRSHAFKSATINVSDLKVDPLPLSDFWMPETPTSPQNLLEEDKSKKKRITNLIKKSQCIECNEDITQSGILYRDRSLHYMRHINEMHTCPVCLFVMPTKCAFLTHMRIHNEEPPYYCPECGVHLPNKSVSYPFSHSCYGFNMMRATMRLKCPMPECPVTVMHPSNYQTHLMEHMKKVYKCSVCIAACFNKEGIEKHVANHNTPSKKYSLFYQCQMCPGKLITNIQLDTHLKVDHSMKYVQPCWTCGNIFNSANELLHHSKICKQKTSNDTKKDDSNNVKIILYRVVKRCDRCKLFFTYKCKYEEINCLPSECPYKCSPGDNITEVSRTEQGLQEFNLSSTIICHLCKNNMPNNWTEIKVHYANLHKEHRCLDGRIVLERIDISAFTKNIKGSTLSGVTKKRTPKRTPKRSLLKPVESTREKESSPHTGNDFICIKCTADFNTKKNLEEHMVVHRDPCTAYQCLECGKCFVVKPSFKTHLLVDHVIMDVENYISSKPCYNEDAFIKFQNNVTTEEPLVENQCNICREKFENDEALEKHYRVHGMAFLMKTTKNNSP